MICRHLGFCLWVLGVCLVFLGCRASYSFRGISIAPEVKTMTIEEFYNNTTLGPSDLANVFE